MCLKLRCKKKNFTMQRPPFCRPGSSSLSKIRPCAYTSIDRLYSYVDILGFQRNSERLYVCFFVLCKVGETRRDDYWCLLVPVVRSTTAGCGPRRRRQSLEITAKRGQVRALLWTLLSPSNVVYFTNKAQHILCTYCYVYLVVITYKLNHVHCTLYTYKCTHYTSESLNNASSALRVSQLPVLPPTFVTVVVFLPRHDVHRRFHEILLLGMSARKIFGDMATEDALHVLRRRYPSDHVCLFF